MNFGMISSNKPAYYLLVLFVGLILTLGFGASSSYAASESTESNSQTEAQNEEQQPDIQNATCTGANLQYTDEINSNECNFGGEDATEKFNQIISEVINLFSIFVGIIAVLMIIVGGFRYIISGGDSANINTAKNTILYAIIGLIVVVFAQVIVKFILSKAVDVAS